ncbi:Zinc transporter [Neocucurbitaria cava]|uniref:Zinc transporter n=1 Tax=Neocucurbitaria cava TaxID=798079 RepID=A0A9W9CI69_9PLEO|nr:Zinc transporter [Neocucurbitaria cava]
MTIASIICIDLIIRQFPGKKNFKIEDSNAFLSTGLSLSFGVMVRIATSSTFVSESADLCDQIFSSLYSMLPSAKNYLTEGGMTPKTATLTLIGCFMVGALGISILSQFLHKFIPHTVVDCNHEHGDEEEGKFQEEGGQHTHQPMQEQQRGLSQAERVEDLESPRPNGTSDNGNPGLPVRRPSLHASISTKVSQLVTGAKKFCDDNGECYGYSDTCGTECFRNVLHTRPPRLNSTKSTGNLATARLLGVGKHHTTQGHLERRPLLDGANETTPLIPTRSVPTTMENSVSSLPSTNGYMAADHESTPLHKNSRSSSSSSASSHDSRHHDHNHDHGHAHDHETPQHHHHVPTNVFLSIGLQTSTAIALHKIPEGFITYATNHANPTLGLSIFLALFIHNITEGFAMALPLYLAIGSRWKAMFWSALLGGVSQPLGAGVAALWFKVAGRGRGQGEGEPGDLVYGCMFAVTAGIMAMVSLQLLAESLDLTHSRRLCFMSAFAGMGILGLSSALTA